MKLASSTVLEIRKGVNSGNVCHCDNAGTCVYEHPAKCYDEKFISEGLLAPGHILVCDAAFFSYAGILPDEKGNDVHYFSVLKRNMV